MNAGTRNPLDSASERFGRASTFCCNEKEKRKKDILVNYGKEIYQLNIYTSEGGDDGSPFHSGDASGSVGQQIESDLLRLLLIVIN